MNRYFKIASLLSILFLTACATGPAWEGTACNDQLNAAYNQLYTVKQDPHFHGLKEWTIASGLLTAAETHYETGDYAMCLKQVKAAQTHIEQSQTP